MPTEQELITESRKIANTIARRITDIEKEDLQQIVAMGLILAYRGHEERGGSLKSWKYKAISTAMQPYLRSAQRTARTKELGMYGAEIMHGTKEP